MINLITNAIKFTDNGTISITYTYKKIEETQETELNFVIEDSGIGMTEVERQKLFKKFSQANSRK